ncbi:MAG: DUF1844 domain-containing protein [Bryobacteraceae bacterium]|nr:DUF1844 domain-containing protein [Bryobacteraceae bacterium]
MPPASFEFLVASLRMQAEMAMGLIKMSDDQPTDLEAARHLIDLLAMLEEKTKSNLTLEEQRFLENSITELRFRYVAAVGEESKSKIVLP